MVHLNRMNRVLSASESTVEVEAGITLHALGPATFDKPDNADTGTEALLGVRPG